MANSPDQIIDELLVLGCQSGDEESFTRLVKRWDGPLRRQALFLTENLDAAADVVQESWMAIARSIRRLREPATFRSWAYRIVGNKAADWIRRTQRRRKLQERLAHTGQLESSSDEASNSDDERPTLLRQFVDELKQDFRQVIYLHYLEDFSVEEISRALNLPPGTVKSRLFHARKQLKQKLERNQKHE